MKKILVIFGLLLVLIIGGVYWESIYSNSKAEPNNTNIYSTVNTCGIKTFDESKFDEMYKNCNLIVVGKVNQKLKSRKLSYHPIATTPGKIEVLKVIKGDFPKDSLLTFSIPGGEITLEEYENSIKNISPESVQKEGLDKLDSNFKKNNYIKYISEDYKDFSVSKTYIMFLNKIGDNDEYSIISSRGTIPIKNSEEIGSVKDISELFDSNK